MNHEVDIFPVAGGQEDIDVLTEILVEVVANGGSVSFMHPLSPERAGRFWRDSLAAADRGVVFGARSAGQLVGTVTLILDCPQNQPHRAEIAKLMIRLSHRGRGVACALMLETERTAVERGRTLLTLDTAAEDGAAARYEGLGCERAGVIPDYAYKPHGGLSATIVLYKKLARA